MARPPKSGPSMNSVAILARFYDASALTVYSAAMPMYEYACRACGHEFETLVRAGETPACKECASAELDKKLSVFTSSTAREPAAACGTCGNPAGPGACALD